MAVKTATGLTKRQVIKDIVLQGDTWGSLLASVQVDSIGKECQKAGYGYLYMDILPVSILGLVDDMVGVTEVGRHRVLCPALHADHDGLLEAAEAGGRARGEAGDLPGVGRLQGSGGQVQRLLLAVHQRQYLRAQLLAPHQGVAHDADCVGEHLLRPAARPLHADLRLRGLEARALAVRQGGHCLAELQEDLAGNLAEADSLPAGGRAGGPLVSDEAVGGGVREEEGREGEKQGTRGMESLNTGI